MTLEDLKTIQRIGTEILLDIDRVCRANGIEYFLMYGTLIGAVRHHGPIPWDDDVDIAMTRENYLKFLEIAPDQLDPRNKVVLMGSGSAQYISEMKVGRRGTQYCLSGTEDLKIMKQVQVDIFLVDYIREGVQNNRQLNKLRRGLEICKLNWDEKRLIMRCAKKHGRRWRLAYPLGLVTMHGVRTILGERTIEKIIYNLYVDKSERSPYVGIFSSVPSMLVWPANSGMIEMEYDGYLLPVPENYDSILRAEYGDYMVPPPEDKRYRQDMSDWVLTVDEP